MIKEKKSTEELFSKDYLICICDVCGEEFEVNPEATQACQDMDIKTHVCSEECANKHLGKDND